ITQFDKDGVEATGLVKIDLLGNRALANVEEVLREIRNPKSEIRISDGVAGAEVLRSPGSSTSEISDFGFRIWDFGFGVYEDTATLQLLRAGDTLGVNQLESPAMRPLLIQLRPRDISDVVCALALIRPGAGAIGMK